MNMPPYRRQLFFLSAGVVLTAIIVALGLSWGRGSASSTTDTAALKPDVSTASPSLECVFYDFTRASVVVAFDFAVALAEGEAPRFDQRSQSARDGTQAVFERDRPVWSYSHDEDGAPLITSPDSAIRIILYGLKLDTGGVHFIEAGLRSNEFRNLQGQCRQINFASAPSASGA